MFKLATPLICMKRPLQFYAMFPYVNLFANQISYHRNEITDYLIADVVMW